MKDIFLTDKFDNKIAFIEKDKSYTFLDFKKMVSSKMDELKSKGNNVVILEDNRLSFIINFFASIFLNKNIYLVSDIKKLSFIKSDFEILKNENINFKDDFEFIIPDFKDVNINFYTSGSTGMPKAIGATLYNLIIEAFDISNLCNFDSNSTVLSSAKLSHRYGLVTYLLFPILSKMTISLDEVAYPDMCNIENSILITTPTFLNSIFKFDNRFKIIPKYIFSAGSKLKDDIFQYFEEITKVIEIYGSTETGDIAYKFLHSENLKLFNCVKIEANEENVKIISPYIKQNETVINDSIKVIDNEIIFNKRTDRLYKIYEKRISADEIEIKLKENELIVDSFVIKHKEKLACLCALSQKGKDYIINNGISKLTKNLKQYLLNYFEIIPQKWKYVDEIPMNSFGKKDKNLIEKIFNINLSTPVILDRKLDNNLITYKIFFNKSCNFFKGHFEQVKIVAGVVQLYYAKEFANIHFNLSINEGQMKRIKFSNVILADSIVYLNLEYDEKHVNFKFYNNDKIYSQGVFLCENIFEGQI